MAVKTRGNVTLTFNSINLTPYMTGHSFTRDGQRIDITNYASSATETLAGDVEFNLEIDGLLTIEVDNALAPEMITPGTKRTLVFAEDLGAQTVTNTWTSNAEVASYTTTGDTKSTQTFKASFALSGAPTRTVA